MLTFDEAELLTRARQLIEKMAAYPDFTEPRRLLDAHFPAGKAYEVAELVHRLARRANRPVVLDFPAPGFVGFGHLGDEVVVPDPGHSGLMIAHSVFLLGINAPATLHTGETWGLTPKGADNAVRRAADWIDSHRYRCPLLATAMRQIRFPNDGRPIYDPATSIEVRVHIAYASAPPR